MIHKLTILLAITALAGAVVAAEKSFALKDLSPEVQKTVNDNLKGGQIRSIGKETERDVVQYEVETMLNGKHRDFNVDTKGNLILVEEETSLDSIPAAARAGIMKNVADGKLGMVELFMMTGGETMYEAAYTGRNGKKHEILVKADGSQSKN